MEEYRGIVLDTDAIIDLLWRAVTLVERLIDSRINPATTVINIFELSWDAYKISRKKVRNMEWLADALIILGLTEETALKAGEEISHLTFFD